MPIKNLYYVTIVGKNRLFTTVSKFSQTCSFHTTILLGLLLCSPTLMREKRAHYVHWCSSDACLFSVFWTICLASHTQSHGHGRPRCQDYLFMRLNQAYDGLRIPSAGAPVSFPEQEGHESCIAPPCHTRDTRRVARATRWEVRGPAWEVRETQRDERESIWTSDLT